MCVCVCVCVYVCVCVSIITKVSGSGTISNSCNPVTLASEILENKCTCQSTPERLTLKGEQSQKKYLCCTTFSFLSVHFTASFVLQQIREPDTGHYVH